MGLSHDIADSKKKEEQYYTHLVQNTEECRALRGDKDDQLVGQEGEDISNLNEANIGEEDIQARIQIPGSKRPEPEEVPDEDDDEDDDDEEALQSPIDDVQNDLINMQKQEYLRQRQIQMVSNIN